MEFTIESVRSNPNAIIANINNYSKEALNNLRSTIQGRRGKEVALVRNAIAEREARMKINHENYVKTKIRKSTSIEEVKHLRREFASKRNCSVQKYADKKLAKLQQVQQHGRRTAKITKQIQAMYDRISALKGIGRTTELIQEHSRSISNDLHDFPKMWTGLESVESIRRRNANPNYRYCLEHFWPRQCSGIIIMESLFELPNFSILTLAEYILRVSRVHVVTPEENDKLKIAQRPTRFLSHCNPGIPYTNAGIILTRSDKTLPLWNITKLYDNVWKDVITGIQ